jgi:hypothetical protein
LATFLVNSEFDYLVEARWRRSTGYRKSEASRTGGQQLESTRGIFVAVPGIRPEVVAQFQGRGCNIIFWDGTDLIEILEGRVDLRDGMRFKIEKAAQEGKAFISLRDFQRR